MNELLALHQFTSEVGASLSVSGVADKAVRQAAAVLDPDAVFLFLREGDALRLKGQWERPGSDSPIAPRMGKVGVCLCGAVISKGRPIYSRDISTDPLCTQKDCKEVGIRSVAVLPLSYDRRVAGVLSLASFTERDFAASRSFLEILASQVSIALQNAHFHEHMQHHIEGMRRELSRREKAEAQLKESEERYRALVEDMPAMICRFLPDGTLTFVNTMYCAYFGRTREDLTGQNFFQFIPEQDREAVRRHYLGLTRENPMVTYQHEVIGAEGRMVRQEWTDRAIFDGQGRLVEYQSIGQDVTERVASERALRESERRFRETLEHLPLIAVILDREGTVTFCNDYFVTLSGWDRGEIIGVNWFERFTPGNASLMGMYEDSKRQETVPSSYENEIVVRSGERRLVHWTNVGLRDADGRFAGVSSIGIDITEHRRGEEALRESETRFRTLSTLAPVGIFLTDADGQSIYSNPRWEEIAGMSARDGFGDGWRSLIHPDDRSFVFERWTAAFEGRRLFATDLRFVRPDGDVRWGSVRANPILSGEGRFSGYVGTVQDITGRKLAEQKVAASLAEKEVLLKEIHHRVKNNLQVIMSLLELQAGSMRDEAAAVAFEESRNRVRSMALMHERFYHTRDIARVNMASYVESVVDSLLHSFGVAGSLRVSVEMSEVSLGLDAAVPCGLIMNELVMNCLKHAFPGGREGSVRVALEEGAKGTLVLRVKDDGIGFAKQGGGQHTPSLGLTIVDTLVKQLRGRFEVKGDNGTEVIVVFPDSRVIAPDAHEVASQTFQASSMAKQEQGG